MYKRFSLLAGAMINSARRISQEHNALAFDQTTVGAYSGYKGEETLSVFTLDGVRLAVEEILDCRYTEPHGCFRVRAGDGGRSVLRYHLEVEVWELVMQERGV